MQGVGRGALRGSRKALCCGEGSERGRTQAGQTWGGSQFWAECRGAMKGLKPRVLQVALAHIYIPTSPLWLPQWGGEVMGAWISAGINSGDRQGRGWEGPLAGKSPVL